MNTPVLALTCPPLFASKVRRSASLVLALLASSGAAIGASPAAPQNFVPLAPPAPSATKIEVTSEIPLRAGWVKSGDQFLPASALRSSNRPAGADSDAKVPSPLSVGSAIAKWPQGRVPYSYDASMTPARKRVFEAACREWEKYADVHFSPRAGQANYLNVIGGDSNGSYLGMTGGDQPLILAASASVMTGCHELGHALGVIHEHQRPGRDEYIAIHPENIEPGFRGFFDVFEGGLNQGPYDFESIMHYGDIAFSVNGQKTITAQPRYAEFQSLMGQDSRLSQGDKSGMALIYGASKVIAASVSGTKVSEAPGGSVARLAVTLTQAASTPVSIRWETRDGTAIAGSDYGAANGALIFAPGELSKTIQVNILDDDIIEPDETLTVRLSGAEGATVSEFDRDGTITIEDGDELTLDEPLPFSYYPDNTGPYNLVASTNVSAVTSMQFLVRPAITGRAGNIAIPEDGSVIVRVIPIRSARQIESFFAKFTLTHPNREEVTLKLKTPDGFEFTLGLPFDTTVYGLSEFLVGRELIGDWTITLSDTVNNGITGTLDDCQLVASPAGAPETLLNTDSDGADSNRWVSNFYPRSLGNGNYTFVARAFKGSVALGNAANAGIYINLSGAPTGLTLSNNRVLQNQAPATLVGILRMQGEHIGPNTPLKYALVAGQGADDNAFFEVRGDTLVTKRPLPSGKSSYSVRLNSDDGAGGNLSKSFVINAVPDGSQGELSVSISPISPATNDVLTARASATFSGSPGPTPAYSFQWLKNDAVIAGETGSTLNLAKPGNGDKGDRISVRVKAEVRDGEFSDSVLQTAMPVTVVNSVPIAISSQGEVEHDTEKGFVLRFYDADGDAVTYKRVGGPRNGVKADIRVDPTDGLTKLFYKSRPFYGSVDIIRFVVFDSSNKQSNESTLGIRVLYTPPPPANRAPIAGDTNIDTVVGKAEVKGLLGSDPDGDAITFRIVGNAKYGTSVIRRDADGAFKLFYTSLPRFFGNDAVTYIATDSRGKESNLATVNINFINRAPLAQGNRVQVASGAEVSQFLFGTDEDGDALSFRLVNNPRFGRGEVKLDAQGKWRFFYTSVPGYVGPDQITFIAIDPQGKESAVAAIDINVVSVGGSAASALTAPAQVPSSGGS